MTQPDSIFVSAREKRLWTWTAVVVIAIYATLGLARRVAGYLNDNDLLSAVFLAGMILILISVVLLAIKLRPRSIELGLWVGIAAVYMMAFLRMAIPEERSHLIEYSVVAALIHEALLERAGHTQNVTSPTVLAFIAIIATSLIGLIDELIQLFLPSRVFDPVDIVFNILAAVMAVGAGSAIRHVRGRF